MNDRLVKKSLSTVNLGRAGVSIEAKVAKKERLKYYKAGFLRGYELAMRDVATLANDNENSAKRRYADQCITDIVIHEPGEE